ncbi:histidine--tRNA ligase [Candidatus Azambacteria bacterium RBG_16_47_10]|uniref:Histidine--tRNA ligase n=1 Tax=Candidatus Azambacteria bacterium RBG_16_47_10 TaxID=1797292 RepID=A0A1F5B056_9BACT|nr:MAG: histidine--tRNA ligase [Candidatus Azambacteria bacterium RBG_16_47_10]
MTAKAKKQFQAPKGTFDILPEDQKYWEKVRKVIKHVAIGYGFERIDTPAIESSDLYALSAGETTDVVEKQMYTFKSRGGDPLTLRPEGTISVMRSFLEHGMQQLPQPVKLYYMAPMFRYEQPQAGRYRQHHQAGFEVLGDQDPIYDAQVIYVCLLAGEELGLKNLSVEINSIGCSKCRPAYRSQLLRYYRSRTAKLCKDCKRRMKKNPLRLLDCKEEKCQQMHVNAPNLIDHLCQECHDHFKLVLEYLDETSIPYVLNSHLVRGFDYYTKTVFEVFLEDEHVEGGSEKSHQRSKLALGGGGRYDNLAKALGGKDVPAVGGSLGMERIIGVMKKQDVKVPTLFKPEVFLIQLGALSKKKSLRLFEDLRKAGIVVAESFGKDSIKAQLRSADRLGVKISLILGQKEAIDGVVLLREMDSGVQESVELEKIIKVVKDRLKK